MLIATYRHDHATYSAFPKPRATYPPVDLQIRSIGLKHRGQGNMQLRAEIKVPMEGMLLLRVDVEVRKKKGGWRNLCDPIGKRVH